MAFFRAYKSIPQLYAYQYISKLQNSVITTTLPAFIDNTFRTVCAPKTYCSPLSISAHKVAKSTCAVGAHFDVSLEILQIAILEEKWAVDVESGKGAGMVAATGVTNMASATSIWPGWCSIWPRETRTESPTLDLWVYTLLATLLHYSRHVQQLACSPGVFQITVVST